MIHPYSDDEFYSRFFSQVSKSDGGCWLWTGCKSNRGYGLLTRRRKVFRSHRISYELTYGKIPSGLYVLHTCDVPSCVNPDHLFLGTQKDNMRDMALKGRSTLGEKNPKAKLTLNQVCEIRELAKSGKNRKEIADSFGVTPMNISSIVSGVSWCSPLLFAPPTRFAKQSTPPTVENSGETVSTTVFAADR